MIINEVTLKNFGIYYGIHSFDFRNKTPDNKILLVKAKNGSGKTTLLSGIKVGLYGPAIMGHRHLSQQYQTYIREKINNQVQKDVEHEASITIDLTLGAHGSPQNIILKRKWLFSTNHINEKVSIFKEGRQLSSEEAARFENQLRQFWPPNLFDFFLFDGEQIHRQLEEGLLMQNMKDAFYSLFNLDLVGNLQSDVLSYLKQDKIFRKLDQEQQKYQQLSERNRCTHDVLSKQSKQIEALGNQIMDLKEQIRQLEYEFKVCGGLAAEERDKAKNKVIILEQKKHQEAEWLKETVSETLPFVMVRDLLSCAHNEVKSEARSKALQVLLSSGFLGLKDNYWRVIEVEHISVTKPGVKDYSAELLDSLVQGLMRYQNNGGFIHDLNEAEIAQLYTLTKEVESFDGRKIKKVLNDISKYNLRILKLNKTIEINKENEELNKLLQRINENTHKIGELSLLKEQLVKQHELEQISASNCTAELARIEKIINQSANSDDILPIVNRIDTVLAKFQHIIIQEKTELLSNNFFDCFTKIMHKDNFVKEVKLGFIDNNFIIELFDFDSNRITYNQLSAGEKQIFLLSLTWALIKTSQREVPIFFDTLLGRLDQSHRKNIIQRFLPYVSKQVVVLSTDTEIDNYYYGLIKPYLSFQYSLNLDPIGRTVQITKETISKRSSRIHAI